MKRVAFVVLSMVLFGSSAFAESSVKVLTGNNLEIVETREIKRTESFQSLKNRKAQLQSQLDSVNDLIQKAKSAGVSE